MIEYACADCGATDCKLWREYQTWSVRLLCAPCAAEHDSRKEIIEAVKHIASDGTVVRSGRKTDQIGWWVPAVPVSGEDAYWGYTSIPDEAYNAWVALPSLPGVTA